MVGGIDPKMKMGGGFIYFLNFHPYLGKMMKFDYYCSNGLVPPTRRWVMLGEFGIGRCIKETTLKVSPCTVLVEFLKVKSMSNLTLGSASVAKTIPSSGKPLQSCVLFLQPSDLDMAETIAG